MRILPSTGKEKQKSLGKRLHEHKICDEAADGIEAQSLIIKGLEND